MKTQNALTDHKCRLVKPTEKMQKLYDGHSLYLAVSPAGGKTWRWAYRLGAKEQLHTIGPYPLISLAEARIRRDALRLRHLNGEDIRVKAKDKKAFTLSEGIATFWHGRRDITEDYRAGALRALAVYIEPELGALPMEAITREQLLDCIRPVDLAGSHVYARRLRMWVGLAFDWAIEHGHAKINPAALIRPEKAFGKRAVKHHASLKSNEVAGFLADLEKQGDLPSVLACRMLALTWVRTGELRQMEWTEIEGDTWRIPAHKMKKRREHLVPLSAPALAILEQMKARSIGSRFVFPCGRKPMERGMSENMVLRLLARMGYSGRMTGHGWRSVASTWANEREYNSDHIEKQLAHDEDDAVRAAYNSAEYMSQRRKMIEDFGAWFERQRPNKVVRIADFKLQA